MIFILCTQWLIVFKQKTDFNFFISTNILQYTLLGITKNYSSTLPQIFRQPLEKKAFEEKNHINIYTSSINYNYICIHLKHSQNENLLLFWQSQAKGIQVFFIVTVSVGRLSRYVYILYNVSITTLFILF